MVCPGAAPGYGARVAKLRIDVWSDIACPWCYVGKRRLEQALAGFAHPSEVEIVWRAFELDPSAPRVRDASQSYAERLARKYGTHAQQAQQMIDRMVDTAAGDGLALRFDHIRPGNTFDAHRLLHLAHERGVQDALKEIEFPRSGAGVHVNYLFQFRPADAHHAPCATTADGSCPAHL